MELLTDRRTRRKKWLWGCTGGCLGFMVAALVLVFVLFRLLRHPVPIPPAEVFLTPRTEAFFVAKVDPEDPLTVDIPVRLVQTRALGGKVPTKSGTPLGEDPEKVRGWLMKVIPMQIVVVLQPGEGQAAFDRAAVLSIERYSRFYRFMATSYLEGAAERGELTLERYKGATVATPREGGTIAVIANSFLAADSRATVTQWVDRLAQEEPTDERRIPESGASAELKAACELLDRSQPILFACLNSRGRLADLLSFMPDGPAREALASAGVASGQVASLSGQLKSINSRDATLTLFLRCTDAAFAARLKEQLDRIAAAYADAGPLREPQVALQGETVVRVKARVEDLPQKIADLAQSVADRQKQGR